MAPKKLKIKVPLIFKRMKIFSYIAQPLMCCSHVTEINFNMSDIKKWATSTPQPQMSPFAG